MNTWILNFEYLFLGVVMFALCAYEIFFKGRSRKAREKAKLFTEEMKKDELLKQGVRLLGMAFFFAAISVFFCLFLFNQARSKIWGQIVTIVLVLAAFCMAGYYAHDLLWEYRRVTKPDKKGKLAYAISWAPYVISFIFMYMALQFVYIMLYVLTQIIWLFKQDYNETKKERNMVYEVYENGFTRTLKEKERCLGNALNDFKPYRRYRDDIGNYWRSYDGGKTFIHE